MLDWVLLHFRDYIIWIKTFLKRISDNLFLESFRKIFRYMLKIVRKVATYTKANERLFLIHIVSISQIFHKHIFIGKFVTVMKIWTLTKITETVSISQISHFDKYFSTGIVFAKMFYFWSFHFNFANFAYEFFGFFGHFRKNPEIFDFVSISHASRAK